MRDYNDAWVGMDNQAAISDLNSTNINALTPIMSTPAEFCHEPNKQQVNNSWRPSCNKPASLTKAFQDRGPYEGDNQRR